METYLAYFIHQCFFSLKSQYRFVCRTPLATRLSLSPSGSFHVLAQVALFCVPLWGPSADASVVSTVWTEQWRIVGWVCEASVLRGYAVAKSRPVSSLLETSEKSSFEMALQSWCPVRSQGGVYTCVDSGFKRGNSKGVGEMAQQGRALALAENLSVMPRTLIWWFITTCT